MTPPVAAAPGDEQAVARAVTRLFWLTDRRRWDDLLEVLADEVRLDYTSLTGGEPATAAAADVAASWRATLGGLDAHQHLVSNLLVDVGPDAGPDAGSTPGAGSGPATASAPSTASVTAQFQATHVLANGTGGDTWTLGGHYRVELTRHDGRWRVAALTMTATWASGNQHVMTLAAQRQQRPRTAAEAARAFLAGLEALDVEAALSVFAEDAVQEMPYAPEGFPRRLEGLEALRRQYGGLPAAYASMRFPITRVVGDGDTAVVEYRGEIELADGGRYDNDYVGIVETRDGRVVRFVERFDPAVLSAAFGERMGETFSVDVRETASPTAQTRA